MHRTLVREMLDQALADALGVRSATQAWRKILAREDIVGIKFDPVGAREIGTSPVVGAALIDSLLEAGWTRRQIVIIDGPPELAAKFDTLPAWPGYDADPVDFGSGKDQFASVLRQITAIISVATLKTDNVTGLRCALSNVSLGFLKHPARFRENDGSPFLADVAALETIRAKLKLTVIDAIRTVYDGGPLVDGAKVSEEGILLVSLDFVAADSVAVGLLNQVRRRKGLPPIAASAEDVPSIADAHRRGLGIALRRGIDVVRTAF